MKQNIFVIILSFMLFTGSSSSAFAISFGKKIEKELKEIKENQGSPSSFTSKIEEDLLNKINQKIDSVTSKIEKEINDKTKKVNAIVSEAEGYIEQARDLKAKAQKYIKILKIVIVILSSGIIILLFVVWRIWKNVVNMRNAFKAVVNYDEVQKRIKTLEKQVAELKAAKK